MVDIEHYLYAALVVFGINLLPGFAPPTWAVLVICALNFGLKPVYLVPIGAVMAASGRWILANVARHFRTRMSEKRKRSLEAVRSRIHTGRKSAIAMVGIFLLSPLPSNQLFLAAGLMDLPLGRLALAFMLGRLVTYSIYVKGASIARESFGDAFREQLTSPMAIAIQVGVFASLALLLLVDWEKVLNRKKGR